MPPLRRARSTLAISSASAAPPAQADDEDDEDPIPFLKRDTRK
jgi:hypothetical protein